MTVRLAFLPLTDAAPLVVAKERGYFERHGVDVELQRQASWASVRDLLQTRRVDGAQLLATMPLALSAGAAHAQVDVVSALVLSLNGNAITVSGNLYNDLARIDAKAVCDPARTGYLLKALIEQRRALGKQRLCFASVYPTSTHACLMRYWMAAAGIRPDDDVRMVVIPPPRMVESLASGLIDGCCVGEPWNSRAAFEGAGQVLLTGFDIWNNAPEKVLGVRREWLEQNRDVHARLLAAIVDAAAWADEPGNRADVAALLSLPQYVDLPEDVIAGSLLGRPADSDRHLPDFHVFSRYAANFPWLSQAEWYVTQLMRWGHLPMDTDIRGLVERVYLPGEFQAAMAGGDGTWPESAYRVEGAPDGTFRTKRFIDGRTFDPEGTREYLDDLRVGDSPAELASVRKLR